MRRAKADGRRFSAWWRGRLRGVRTRGGDEGSETVEIAVLFPLVILIVLVTLQAGLYFHARSVAMSAAQEGARIASGAGGTVEAGQTAAQAFAEEMGSGELKDVQSTVEASGDMVHARVSGTSVSLVPGWHPKVTGRSTAALERVTW